MPTPQLGYFYPLDNSSPPDRPEAGLPPYLDNSLPVPPPPPGYIGLPPGPVDPGFGLGLPPIASHPLPRPPAHISGGPVPPGYEIGYPLPPTYPTPPPVVGGGPILPPSIWPTPPWPPTTWPPPSPIRPDLPMFPLPPDQSLPAPPGAVWPPIDGVNGPILVLVWVPGHGYRWTVVDPSLSIGFPLPPTPEPKR